jgi:hypothetical protein
LPNQSARYIVFQKGREARLEPMGEAIGTLTLNARSDSEMARQALETAQNGLEKSVGSLSKRSLNSADKARRQRLEFDFETEKSCAKAHVNH